MYIYRYGSRKILRLKLGVLASIFTSFTVIEANGTASFAGIAKEMNAKRIKTARGGQWHASSVKRLSERLDQAA